MKIARVGLLTIFVGSTSQQNLQRRSPLWVIYKMIYFIEFSISIAFFIHFTHLLGDFLSHFGGK